MCTRLSDDYLFTVELDLDVHDEAVSHKETPAGCVTAPGLPVRDVGGEPTTKNPTRDCDIERAPTEADTPHRIAGYGVFVSPVVGD